MLLTREDILACSGHAVAVDTETNGLHFWENKMIGVGIECPTANGGKGIRGYAHTCTFEQQPLGKAKTHQEWLGKMDFSKSSRGRRVKELVNYQPTTLTAIPNDLRIYHFSSALAEIACNPKTTLIGHNLKFDLHMLGLESWRLPCRIMDTSVMVHLIDSRLLKSLDASELVFLGKTSKRQHVQKADRRFLRKPWLWEEQVLEDYCSNDCVVTYQLAQTLYPEIRSRGLTNLYALQMRYLRLLQKIERHGILITTVFCHEAIRQFEQNLREMEKSLYDTIGYRFNWHSSTQLSKAIYEDMGIARPQSPYNPDEERFDLANFRAAKLYTESATSTPLLVKENHPLRGLILGLRETDKLRDYAEQYIRFRDSGSRIHSSFNLTRTLTGRLSSSSPNLQQLPSEKRKFEVENAFVGGAVRQGVYNLRQAIVARSGSLVVSIDHKQQEMRMLAILSQEPVLLAAMVAREDIHLRVALRVWGDCGEGLNKIHRDWSKAISFGLIYGLGEMSLQEYFGKVGVQADAREVKEQYFAAFPGLQPWFQEVIRYVQENGYVRYWSGRYWFADDPGEGYKGINALIQGGCADLISVAALRIGQILEKQGWGNILSIIHDEILLEIREDVLEEACPVLVRAMEVEDLFDVPFAADIEVGESYGTLGGYPLSRKPSEIDWKAYT